jgi:hypothetical protein
VHEELESPILPELAEAYRLVQAHLAALLCNQRPYTAFSCYMVVERAFNQEDPVRPHISGLVAEALMEWTEQGLITVVNPATWMVKAVSKHRSTLSEMASTRNRL